MQELSERIRDEVDTQAIDKFKQDIDPQDHLRETSKKWAVYVLEVNRGELVEKGLAISKAIVNYINALEEPVPTASPS